MHLLQDIAGLLLQHAHASTVEQLGSGPGIDGMWGEITGLFNGGISGRGSAGLAYILGKITRFILESIAALAVAAIIYGGITMITKGEEGLAEGKKMVQYACAGLICAMVADAVVIYLMTIISTVSST